MAKAVKKPKNSSKGQSAKAPASRTRTRQADRCRRSTCSECWVGEANGISHLPEHRYPAARFLAALAEHEMADRGRRRIERHLTEARLPAGKTLATFDFEAVPTVSKAQVMALASGDAWLATRRRASPIGPPARG
jgi:DNA replication protein DnaC